MHRITEKICKERWQHWCTKISGVKVLPTLLISTITSNMSFIQLSLMLSGYPTSSFFFGVFNSLFGIFAFELLLFWLFLTLFIFFGPLGLFVGNFLIFLKSFGPFRFFEIKRSMRWLRPFYFTSFTKSWVG